MIPETAVEAAYRVASFDCMEGKPFESKEDVRRILEAAAPHMLAEAWELGREVGLDQDFDATTQITNPYMHDDTQGEK